MIEARSFVEMAKRLGFSLYTGVPCSYVKPFINYVIDAPEVHYVGATNEGDAVAIASGAELGGKPAIVMMQNSGLGNAISPLTSLNAIFHIPILLIVTLRGEPGGPADEPQHELMGAITTRMLEFVGVVWEWFPQEESEVQPALQRATQHMKQTNLPYCFVMKKDSVAPIKHSSEVRASSPDLHMATGELANRERPSRHDALLAIQRAVDPHDIVIATTGFTGRELYACEDRPNQLYMVGSMGCASSLGLGLALAQPNRRVVVIDGDGAILMRLGALATLGHERPPNLVHILLDNEVHDSTGAQSTVSHTVDLGAVAKACRYPIVSRIKDAVELETAIRGHQTGLCFFHVKTKPGVSANLPRPTVKPHDVAARLRTWIRSGSS